MLDPAQLHLLQVIARTGSYSAAARELGYTQPAITYQMRMLERAAGSALAVRHGRTMQLTEAGKLLLQHAGRILAGIRAAENELAVLAGEPRGHVRLAAFPSSCAALVPAALASMRRSHPGISVELIQAELADSHQFVQRGGVDLALTYHLGPCQHAASDEPIKGLSRLAVMIDDIRLILPVGHPTACKRIVGIEELATATWFAASPNTQLMLTSAAGRYGFTPKVMRVADDYVTIQALVAQGLGVALIPNLALQAHTDNRIVPRTLRAWPKRHIEIEVWSDVLRVDAIRILTDHIRIAAGLVGTVALTAPADQVDLVLK